jgi:hypothetical protein
MAVLHSNPPTRGFSLIPGACVPANLNTAKLNWAAPMGPAETRHLRVCISAKRALKVNAKVAWIPDYWK